MKAAGIHTEDMASNAIAEALESFDPAGMTEGQLTAVRRLAFLAESYSDIKADGHSKGKRYDDERRWHLIGDQCAEVWGKVLRELKGRI